MDIQFQIKGETTNTGRPENWKNFVLGKYMEIKITYKQMHKNIIEDKKDYKQRHFHQVPHHYREATSNFEQRHFHDYSVITSNI
eukprot:932311-Amphidinium_carterae.1